MNMLSNHFEALNMHQNERYQVWFFKKFLGRGLSSHLSKSLSQIFLSSALGSSFALNSWVLCAFDLGFGYDF